MQNNDNFILDHGLNSRDVGNRHGKAVPPLEIYGTPNTHEFEVSPREYQFESNEFNITPRDYDIPTNDVTNILGALETQPGWKQEILRTKEMRRNLEVKKIREEKERQRLEAERRRLEEEKWQLVPHWKRELIEKKQYKEVSYTDDITARKKSIVALEDEMENPLLPPWQKEIRRKKRERLLEEVRCLQEKRQEEIEKRRAYMAGPVHEYIYNQNDFPVEDN